ncbi:MAG: hypothetical protein R2767_03675 [Chitinophagales bacterium]|mgnify:CR=1 FL=1|nr:hypothetical protein [Bacteroidota bacterium]HAE34802.1 hypothetical protein [Bacteroidota bacterium]HPE96533.1 hypothetical protein [Chitinophagales bacterium]HPR27979.1 hypothetical protein [Chitinophagales bacterium]HRX23353.1 hypothetical protein [Chitinophagales bacterium]
MKRILTLMIAFMIGTALFAQQEFTFTPAGKKSKTIATVMQKGDTWILREGQGSVVIDYLPVNLPEEFKTDGQEVVFEGVLGEIPANVRLQGKPVEITLIKRLYRAVPKDKTDDIGHTDGGDKKQPEAIENLRGVVMLVANTWLIEGERNGHTERFVPDNMPEEFREEGLEVFVSGSAGYLDPNVRAMGRPFRITELTAVVEQKMDTTAIQEPMKDLFPFQEAGRITAVEGVVKLFSSDPDIYIIETNNGTRRYLPAIIPDAFKVHNLRVLVTGVYGEIPANVRLMGTPFEIEVIEEIK